MTAQPDTEPMRRALEAALAGPAADPNPRVGAVVLDAAGDL
nr:riboflavin biosynthesis protein RibD [Actinomycetota bacterium]